MSALINVWSALSMAAIAITALAIPLCGIIFAIAAVEDAVTAFRARRKARASSAISENAVRKIPQALQGSPPKLRPKKIP